MSEIYKVWLGRKVKSDDMSNQELLYRLVYELKEPLDTIAVAMKTLAKLKRREKKND